jgi:hypothetical protein
MSKSEVPTRTLANRAGRQVVDVKFCVDNPSAVSTERLRSENGQIQSALASGDYVELPRT